MGFNKPQPNWDPRPRVQIRFAVPCEIHPAGGTLLGSRVSRFLSVSWRLPQRLLLKQRTPVSQNPRPQAPARGLPGARCHLPWPCLDRAVMLSGLCRPLLGPLSVAPRAHQSFGSAEVGSGHRAGQGSFLWFCPPAVTRQKFSLRLWGEAAALGVTCPSKGRKPFPGVSDEPQGLCFCALGWGELGAPVRT